MIEFGQSLIEFRQSLIEFGQILSANERTYIDLVTASGLEEIAKYAQAVGIHKNLLVPKDSSGKLRSPTSLVINAHAVGLLVHVWTFCNEDCFLLLDFQGNPQGEYELFFSLGVNGVFSDYPDTTGFHFTVQW
ncbi:MAG: glycerophosphodiester phosphodiesterase family protein [Nostoc sp.]|uniref:glycerophosphodiester phosphodiesterase family protein n=1 Tax=Nostoc sp. TaxID=1180 RepID=UPI002FF50C9C